MYGGQIRLIGVLKWRLHVYLSFYLMILHKLVYHIVWLEGVFHDDLTSVELNKLILLACNRRGLKYQRAKLFFHRLFTLHHYKA